MVTVYEENKLFSNIQIAFNLKYLKVEIKMNSWIQEVSFSSGA